MKRHMLAFAVALALTVGAASPTAAHDGKRGSREGVTPNVPTTCWQARWEPRYFYPGGHTVTIWAVANWCANASNKITSFDNPTYVALGAWQGCTPYFTSNWRYSGGIGYTWYTTEIDSYWNCNDGHLHSVVLGWAHNGWGTSSIAWQYLN